MVKISNLVQNLMNFHFKNLPNCDFAQFCKVAIFNKIRSNNWYRVGNTDIEPTSLNSPLWHKKPILLLLVLKAKVGPSIVQILTWIQSTAFKCCQKTKPQGCMFRSNPFWKLIVSVDCILFGQTDYISCPGES